MTQQLYKVLYKRFDSASPEASQADGLFPKHEAQARATRMNSLYKEAQHWAEPATEEEVREYDPIQD